MLRVQPTREKFLGGDRKNLNTVGNIKSGTTGILKEARLYDWYVIEIETIEHGVRTGFVHKEHLKEPTPHKDIPEGAYDYENQQCVGGGQCLKPPPTAPDREAVVSNDNQPVFGCETLMSELKGQIGNRN